MRITSKSQVKVTVRVRPSTGLSSMALQRKRSQGHTGHTCMISEYYYTLPRLHTGMNAIKINLRLTL